MLTVPHDSLWPGSWAVVTVPSFTDTWRSAGEATVASTDAWRPEDASSIKLYYNGSFQESWALIETPNSKALTIRTPPRKGTPQFIETAIWLYDFPGWRHGVRNQAEPAPTNKCAESRGYLLTHSC